MEYPHSFYSPRGRACFNPFCRSFDTQRCRPLLCKHVLPYRTENIQAYSAIQMKNVYSVQVIGACNCV